MVNRDDCWLWAKTVGNHGYGLIGSRPQQLAHRIIYEALVGPVPEGLELDHLCRVQICVNPDHLEPVTHHENTLRGKQGEYLKERKFCPRGHAYNGYNLIIRKSGARTCRTCNNIRSIAYQKRLRKEVSNG